MRSKPKATKNPRLPASTKKLLHSLNIIVAVNEAHLYESAKHAGEDEGAAKARIQEHLNAVRESLHSADSPVPEHSQHSPYPARYVHVNQWRAAGISACANMIVAMQNAKH